MLSILCSTFVGLLAGFGTYFGAKIPWGWALFFGILAFMVVNVVVSLVVRRVSGLLNKQIEMTMMETRQKLEAMQNRFAYRPAGSQKQMMAMLEKEQNNGIRKGLECCDSFRKLYLWSPLLEKQINAMKVMFHFQLKEYDMVDALLPKCLMMDPQIMALKMVRMYKNGAENIEIDKFFSKKCAKLKGERAVLPVALYSWILVKQERSDEAFKVLSNAKQRCDHEVIVSNWEHLANNRVKNFSNAPLGELWYAMGLEEMKMPRMRQQYRYR